MFQVQTRQSFWRFWGGSKDEDTVDGEVGGKWRWERRGEGTGDGGGEGRGREMGEEKGGDGR